MSPRIEPGPYLYILSDHAEDGAENVCATLDRSLLPRLIDRNWPDTTERWRADAKAGLAHLLKESDEELLSPDGHNCHHGWGGIQLHVVRLQVARVEALAS